jgi:hypothetical protein
MDAVRETMTTQIATETLPGEIPPAVESIFRTMLNLEVVANHGPECLARGCQVFGGGKHDWREGCSAGEKSHIAAVATIG